MNDPAQSNHPEVRRDPWTYYGVLLRYDDARIANALSPIVLGPDQRQLIAAGLEIGEPIQMTWSEHLNGDIPTFDVDLRGFRRGDGFSADGFLLVAALVMREFLNDVGHDVPEEPILPRFAFMIERTPDQSSDEDWATWKPINSETMFELRLLLMALDEKA